MRLHYRVITLHSYIMKTILIAAQKGGSGKTTLTRNLAVVAAEDGRNVLCLDLDPQGSLRGWWESREADSPSMLDRDPLPDVLRTTLDAARERFDLCIIDTPPAASEWLAEALAAADLVLIPVRPSPDDLRAVGTTLAAVNGSDMPFVFVMSQDAPRADHRGSRPRAGPAWPSRASEYRSPCRLCRDRSHGAGRHRNQRQESRGGDCRRVELRERNTQCLRKLWPLMDC